MSAADRVDQLAGDAHAISGFPDGALQYIANTKFLFWHFTETVEKGPLLAGFFDFGLADLGLRSRKCGFRPLVSGPRIPVPGAVPIVRDELHHALI